MNPFVLPTFYELMTRGVAAEDHVMLLACDFGATLAAFPPPLFEQLVASTEKLHKENPEAVPSTTALLVNNALGRLKVYSRSHEEALLDEAAKLAFGSLRPEELRNPSWNLVVLTMHEVEAPVSDEKDAPVAKGIMAEVHFVYVPTLPPGQRPRGSSGIISTSGAPVEKPGAVVRAARQTIH